MQGVSENEVEKMQILGRMRENAGPAMANIQTLIAQINAAKAA
jgi:hypothetical protein